MVLRGGRSFAEVGTLTPYQARMLLKNLDRDDGSRELQHLLLEIMQGVFGKKAVAPKTPPKTREGAMVERFGGIELPA